MNLEERITNAVMEKLNDGTVEQIVKVSPPRKVSEEQAKAAGERFRKMREEKKGENCDE